MFGSVAVRKSSLLLFAVTFLLSACTVATMKIDPELAGRTEPLSVTGHNPRLWNRPLAFGPFRTEQVSEGGEWRWAGPLLGGEAGVAWQRYRLTLTDGEQRIQAACKTRRVFFERDGWSIDPSLGRLPALQCALRPETGGDAWVLTLRNSGPRFSGSLEPEGGGTAITLKSAHRAEGGIVDSADPVGFTIEQNGAVIGAVETINRGRVWIDPSVAGTGRLRAAAAAAALLLFDPAD
jgi:hypothetical protein